MQSISFYLPIKPISYNQSHVVVGNTLRNSTQNKHFKLDASKLLTPHIKQIKKYCKEYQENLPIGVKYIFWIPEKHFYTTKGNISKTSLDLDNCVKSINDVVFKRMAKYNPSIDDGKITEMILTKKPHVGEAFGISVTIW